MNAVIGGLLGLHELVHLLIPILSWVHCQLLMVIQCHPLWIAGWKFAQVFVMMVAMGIVHVMALGVI